MLSSSELSLLEKILGPEFMVRMNNDNTKISLSEYVPYQVYDTEITGINLQRIENIFRKNITEIRLTVNNIINNAGDSNG